MARQRLLESRSQQQVPLLAMAAAEDGQERPQRPRLSQRLLSRADDQPLPQQLLRKYIAYARYLFPRSYHAPRASYHLVRLFSLACTPTQGSTSTRACPTRRARC